MQVSTFELCLPTARTGLGSGSGLNRNSVICLPANADSKLSGGIACNECRLAAGAVLRARQLG